MCISSIEPNFIPPEERHRPNGLRGLRDRRQRPYGMCVGGEGCYLGTVLFEFLLRREGIFFRFTVTSRAKKVCVIGVHLTKMCLIVFLPGILCFKISCGVVGNRSRS